MIFLFIGNKSQRKTTLSIYTFISKTKIMAKKKRKMTALKTLGLFGSLASIIGLALVFGTSSVNIEGDGNIVGDGNTINNFFDKFRPKNNNKKIIGNWETSESWSKFIGTMHIQGLTKFKKDNTFESEVAFTAPDINFSSFKYSGKWSIKDGNIIFKEIKVVDGKLNDALTNTLFEGIHQYNAIMIFKKYLNHPNNYKIEEIGTFGNEILKTNYTNDGDRVEKFI